MNHENIHIYIKNYHYTKTHHFFHFLFITLDQFATLNLTFPLLLHMTGCVRGQYQHTIQFKLLYIYTHYYYYYSHARCCYNSHNRLPALTPHASITTQISAKTLHSHQILCPPLMSYNHRLTVHNSWQTQDGRGQVNTGFSSCLMVHSCTYCTNITRK